MDILYTITINFFYHTKVTIKVCQIISIITYIWHDTSLTRQRIDTLLYRNWGEYGLSNANFIKNSFEGLKNNYFDTENHVWRTMTIWDQLKLIVTINNVCGISLLVKKKKTRDHENALNIPKGSLNGNHSYSQYISHMFI